MLSVDWDSVDWKALERLRRTFLASGEVTPGPYWTDAWELASYDFTLGRRIAWKWAAVLEPLLRRGWKPPGEQLVDWGCGSGIATRSLLAHLPPGSVSGVVLWDHAPEATNFATGAVRRRYPHLQLRVADPIVADLDEHFTLLVSHVLNELDPTGVAQLVSLARRAAAVIWVEAGTHAVSRALIEVRERLRDAFQCIAPCPHQEGCGMLAAGAERHWCHQFARVPTEAFTEPGWAELSRRLGIDLRSLPYSYLVLDRRPTAEPGELRRLIGRPRQNRGAMRVLRCSQDGVREVLLERRVRPDLWRAFDRGRHDGLFTWSEKAGRIDRLTS